ncbi:MAG: holo-ACP synthase [Acidimicrobiales bacterium]
MSAHRDSDSAQFGSVRGIGVDAVDVGRFRQVLERRPALKERLFTSGELSYALGTADPIARLAARFAAKEAAMKALGLGMGGVDFAEVEVVRSQAGSPSLALHGRAITRAAERGVRRWHLSLTHTDLVAIASVVAVAGP